MAKKKKPAPGPEAAPEAADEAPDYGPALAEAAREAVEEGIEAAFARAPGAPADRAGGDELADRASARVGRAQRAVAAEARGPPSSRGRVGRGSDGRRPPVPRSTDGRRNAPNPRDPPREAVASGRS